MLPYEGYAETRFAFDPRRRTVWREIAAYLQRWVPPQGAVLELGSGYCDFINSIRAARRWALDLHLDPAKWAEGGVVPLQRDVADLAPLGDGSLDCVFASNLFEHLDDAKLVAAADAALAKLRPGGRLILVQPNFACCFRRYFDDYTHCRVFTHVSLADFLRARGFEIERVTPRFLPFSLRSRAPKWPWLVRLYLRSPWRPGAQQMLVIARKPAAPVAPGGLAPREPALPASAAPRG